jgi:hypothetical protein
MRGIKCNKPQTFEIQVDDFSEGIPAGILYPPCSIGVPRTIIAIDTTSLLSSQRHCVFANANIQSTPEESYHGR